MSLKQLKQLKIECEKRLIKYHNLSKMITFDKEYYKNICNSYKTKLKVINKMIKSLILQLVWKLIKIKDKINFKKALDFTWNYYERIKIWKELI